MARKAKLVQEEIEDQVDDENEVVDLEDEVSDEEGSDKELEEDSASMGTLHPGAGSNAGTESRSAIAARLMGALANIDKSKLEMFNGMISTHFGKDFGIPDGASERNKSTIKAKPSDAVGGGDAGKMPVQGSGTSVKESIAQDVNEIFEGTELTGEFKAKATVLFEAALEARINEERVKLEEEYEERLQDELEEINESVSKNVETYIEYVAEEWMKENEVAIESSLRNEITTEFMGKLRDLFIESNVNIPEEEVEVVDALAGKVEELEGRLAEAIQENADLREIKEAVEKAELVEEAAEGMTLVEKEKLQKLVEGVDAGDVEEFQTKLEYIKESIKPVKKSTVSTLMEEVDENNSLDGGEKKAIVDPSMKRFVDAIERTVKSETV